MNIKWTRSLDGPMTWIHKALFCILTALIAALCILALAVALLFVIIATPFFCIYLCLSAIKSVFTKGSIPLLNIEEKTEQSHSYVTYKYRKGKNPGWMIVERKRKTK